MKTTERYALIKKAVLRRRMARIDSALGLLPGGQLRAGIGGCYPGKAVTLFDAQGRYVVGKIIDDEAIRVYESNLVSPWSVLYKDPVLTWEECLKVRKGATRLRPRDLVGFTRLFLGPEERVGRNEEAREPRRRRAPLEQILAS